VKGPKILLLDIETAPIIAQVWNIWDQNVGLNQIQQDWQIIAWCAKWYGKKKLFYKDQRKNKNLNDKEVLKQIWDLMNEADIIVGQNSKKFDVKKLNARFIFNGFKPPSSYRQFDTFVEGKRLFGFTSYKLEYMSEHLDTKYKKLKHKKFPGHELWSECLKGNQQAWNEMEKYNKHDVLALEEVYKKFLPWSPSTNVNLFHDGDHTVCTCGSNKFSKNGFFYAATGRYQRYACSNCGAEIKDRYNLLNKMKRQSLKK
jgi:hypothetical protein